MEESTIQARQLELDMDIAVVVRKLNQAKTFEATLAFRKLLEKLKHERRMCGKKGYKIGKY